MIPSYTEVEASPSYINPLVKEVNGRQLYLEIVSDIDGTANREDFPEGERLGSIAPATEAFAPYVAAGHDISLMSSRTLPEIAAYADAMGLNGYKIGEDGGIIALPSNMSEEDIKKLEAAGITVTIFEGERVVLNSSTTVDTIAEIVQRVENELGQPIVSTVSSTPEQIQQSAGHHSLQMAKDSMARLASAYAVDVSPEQFELLQKYMQEAGIRVLGGTFDKITQFFGTNEEGLPADKSSALALLDRIISIVHGVDGMLPIVFGNGKNDIPLWEMALKMGGKAALIPRHDGKPFVDEELIPEGVVRATKPAGEGIGEVLQGHIGPWIKTL